MAPTCRESVVRFFDNGEKQVVRLRFDGFELVCTPEHPFYVVDKGWTRASALAVGDLALNAYGERVAFLGREAVDGTRRVYNIEVEDAHTYFVGDGGRFQSDPTRIILFDSWLTDHPDKAYHFISSFIDNPLWNACVSLAAKQERIPECFLWGYVLGCPFVLHGTTTMSLEIPRNRPK